MSATILNATDGPLPYDRAGRVLGARETMPGLDETASPVSGHIAAGRFVVVTQEPGAIAEAVEDDDNDVEPVDTDAQPTPPKRTRKGRTTDTQEA